MDLAALRAKRAWLPVATRDEVALVGQRLGQTLPDGLVRLYTEVGNGTSDWRVFPYFTPLAELESLSASFAKSEEDVWHGLFPFADWGCAHWTCTRSNGRVYATLPEEDGGPMSTRYSDLETWFADWLAGSLREPTDP